MTNTDREGTASLTGVSKDLMDVWLRERREALAKQLAANAEIKQRWMASNPIEIGQRRQGYHVNPHISEEGSATDRWENEGGHCVAKHVAHKPPSRSSRIKV